MTTKEQIVSEARQWLHTPFMHQGAMKGVGADCIGFIRGVGAELHVWHGGLDTFHEGHKYLGYSPFPDGKTLRMGLDENLDRVPFGSEQIGDVALIAWDKDPQHVGFLTDHPNGGFGIIHALGVIGRKGRIIEQRIDDSLRRKIVAFYRIRGID